MNDVLDHEYMRSSISACLKTILVVTDKRFLEDDALTCRALKAVLPETCKIELKLWAGTIGLKFEDGTYGRFDFDTVTYRVGHFRANVKT